MEDDQNPTGPDLQYLVAPTTEADYENMPASEVAYQAVTNLPGSIYEMGKGLVTAVAHPIETGKALGNVGYGLGSMAYGALGGEQDPTAKAQNEALARAMIEPYTSVAAFKKELATNPAGPLSLLLPGAGGALTKTGELLGATSRLGSIATKLGRAAEVGATVVDPARALVEGASAVGKFGPRAAAVIPEWLTGTPDAAFEYAFKAGAERGLNAQPIREGFNQFYKGTGNVVGLSQDIAKAVGQMKAKASSDWLASRGQVTGAATAPIDYSSVRTALDDAYSNFGGPPGTQTSAFPDARAALNDAEALIREYTKDPPGTGKNTLAGLDELKRALKTRADNASGKDAQQAYLQVHGSVRQLLGNISPEYSKLMDDYATILDEMTNLKKSLGDGSNIDPNAQLKKAIKALQTPGGQEVLQKISTVDPTIPFKIAGAALHNNPVGWRQAIVGGAPAVTYALNQIAEGNIGQIATAVPILIGGAMASSPKVMGKVAYGAGRVGAGVGAMADLPIAPGATVGDLVSGASKGVYPVGLAAEQISLAQDKVDASTPPALEMPDGTSIPILEPGQTTEGSTQPRGLVVDVYPPGDPRNAPEGSVPRGQAAGGRIERKSGGRVANAISAEVVRTRALLGNKTASILSIPDDAIISALNLARKK